MKEEILPEDRTKSESKQIFWNYFSILSGQLGSMVLNLFILSITARLLQPAGYGILSLFLMVASLFATLIINWPNSAIIRFGKEEFLKTGKIAEVFRARVVIFAFTLASSLAIVFFLGSRITGYIGMEKSGLLVLVLYILINSVYEMVPYTLQATGNMKVFGSMPIFEKSVTLLLLLLVLFGIIRISVTNILLCAIAGQIVVIIIALTRVSPALQGPGGFSRQRIRQMLGWTWSLSIAAVASFAFGWIDVVIIKMFMQEVSSVGVYSVAYKGMTFLSAMIMSTISLTFPLITSLRTTGRNDLIVRYLDELIPQGVLVWSFFLSFIISVSGLFVPFLLGASYTQTILPFMILSVGISFNSITCFYIGIMSAFDLVKEIVFISIFLSIINLLLNVLLVPVPWLGINGAAAAKALSIFVSNYFYISLINRQGSFGSTRKRFIAYFWSLPALITFLGCLFFQSWFMRLAVFAAVVAAFLAVAKRSGVFSERTTEIVNYVDMPLMLKNTINKVIRRMS